MNQLTPLKFSFVDSIFSSSSSDKINFKDTVQPLSVHDLFRLKTAINRRQVEIIEQMAIADSLIDFYPIPLPVIDKMLDFAHFTI